jgi:hypothetical protein
VFLEKPFNAKEFPSFLMSVLVGGEPQEEEQARGRFSGVESIPVSPGERYQEPSAPEVPEEGIGEEEPVGEAAEPEVAEDFYHYLDQGFVRIHQKDWAGAREQWLMALQIRPDDRRLRANIQRLERMMEDTSQNR